MCAPRKIHTRKGGRAVGREGEREGEIEVGGRRLSEEEGGLSGVVLSKGQ